jgi:cell division protein ZapA
MEDELFTITVNVAGHRYPLKIKRSDEIIYRDAAKFLKEKIDSYQERHSHLSYEAILVMVAYHFAVESEKVKHQETVGPVIEKLDTLDQELEQYLNGLQ